MSKLQPLDHLRSRKKAIWIDFFIVDDTQYSDRVNEARSELSRRELQLRLSRSGEPSTEDRSELADLQETLEVAETEMKPHQLWFRARSISPKQYDKLVSDHPPTAEQRKEAKARGDVMLYDPDTFLYELASRCVYYLYCEVDGVTESAYPPFGDKRPKDQPEVREEPLTLDFLQNMREDGNWAAGEILTVLGTAANVNQGIRQVAQLGNV